MALVFFSVAELALLVAGHSPGQESIARLSCTSKEMYRTLLQLRTKTIRVDLSDLRSLKLYFDRHPELSDSCVSLEVCRAPLYSFERSEREQGVAALVDILHRMAAFSSLRHFSSDENGYPPEVYDALSTLTALQTVVMGSRIETVRPTVRHSRLGPSSHAFAVDS